jgi:hypothetical protein
MRVIITTVSVCQRVRRCTTQAASSALQPRSYRHATQTSSLACHVEHRGRTADPGRAERIGVLEFDNLHPRRRVRVVGLFALLTDRHAGKPLVLERLVDAPPRLRIGVKHVLDHVPTFSGDEVVERRWGRVGRRAGIRLVMPHGEVLGKRRVRGLCDAPWQFLELHTVEDNGRGPDVDESRVIFYNNVSMQRLIEVRMKHTFVIKQLGRNVRF